MTDPAQRKKLGAYYTPMAVARSIVNKALESLQNASLFPATPLSVLDPCCGTGIFLVALVEALGEIATRNVSRVRLHGLDIDRGAVHVARENVSSAIRDHGLQDRVTIGKIGTGNFLASPGALEPPNRFDLIIGNPPYIAWDAIPKVERASLFEAGCYDGVSFPCRPNHHDAQPNYHLFFMVHAARLLSEVGMIAFLLPVEWLHHERATVFRNFLLDSFSSIHVAFIEQNTKLFHSGPDRAATTSSMLFLSRSGEAGSGITCEFIDGRTLLDPPAVPLAPDAKPRVVLAAVDARGRPWTFIPPSCAWVMKKILSSNMVQFSNKTCFEIHGGFQPPVEMAKAFEICKDEYDTIPLHERGIIHPLVLDAREIVPYMILYQKKRYWIIANDFSSEGELLAEYPSVYEILRSRLDTDVPRWWAFPNVRNLALFRTTTVKLLAPRTASRPSFALDPDQTVFKGTNAMIVCKRHEPRYVLAILNSKLNAWYQQMAGFQYHGGKTRKLEPAKLRSMSIPILNAPIEEQRALADLVDDIIALLQQGNPVESNAVIAVQARIDERVFELYNLDGEDLRVIDAMA